MRKSKAGHGKMWRMRRGRVLRKRRKMAEHWRGFPILGEGSLECWGGEGGLNGEVPSGLLVLLSPAEVLPLNHTKCVSGLARPVIG